MSVTKKLEELKAKNAATDVQVEDNEDYVVKATYDINEKLAVASTDVVDRHGERIDQEGWDLKNFKKNPVMLWAHDHSEIAVGVCKNVQIQRTSGTPKLVFTPEFHDKTEKAKALKALFDEGWLNSFSVGFMPKEFDGKTSTYLKQELLEISAVNVPANPDARMLAFKSLKEQGFKKSTLKNVLEVTDEDIASLDKIETEEKETTETKTEKEKRVEAEMPVEKGPVSDQINAEEVWEQKANNMSQVRDIWWAFCDVYYDEETAVDDFKKLLGETIELLSKVQNGDTVVDNPDEDSEDDDMMDDKSAKNFEVLDSPQNIDNSDNKLSEETDSQAKTQENEETSVAPKKQTRAKQELTKVIIQAASSAQPKDADTEKMLKIIKRAAEILSSANKGN